MTKPSLPTPGDVGMFRESGNMVRVRQFCTDRRHAGLLQVERIGGGKGMLILPAAFIPEADLVNDGQSDNQNELLADHIQNYIVACVHNILAKAARSLYLTKIFQRRSVILR